MEWKRFIEMEREYSENERYRLVKTVWTCELAGAGMTQKVPRQEKDCVGKLDLHNRTKRTDHRLKPQKLI